MERLGKVDSWSRHYLIGVGRAVYEFRYGELPDTGELTDMLNTELGLMLNELGFGSMGELAFRTCGDVDVTLAIWMAAAVNGESDGEIDVVSMQSLSGQDGSQRDRGVRVRRPD